MERKDQIREFLKRAKTEGDVSGSGIIVPRKTIEKSLLQGRDLAEEALADEVLRNTGVPIPGKGASRSQIENFLQDIAKERYPELGDMDLDLIKDLSKNEGAVASYNPATDKLLMDRERVAKSPVKAVADLLHESGHRYDNKILGNNSGKEIDDAAFRAARSEIKSAPNFVEGYDAVARKAKHHAEIPSLREGSFGLGALKSMLKSGKFKGMAPILAKGAAAGATGLMSLASEAADAETLNDGTEEEAFIRDMQEKNRRMKTLEQYPEAQKMYDEMDSGKAFDIKRDALRNLIKK